MEHVQYYYSHCYIIVLQFCSSCVLAFMDCIVPADIAHCQNDGTCRINLLTDSLSCVCPTAYSGDTCEQSMFIAVVFSHFPHHHVLICTYLVIHRTNIVSCNKIAIFADFTTYQHTFLGAQSVGGGNRFWGHSPRIILGLTSSCRITFHIQSEKE